MEEGLHTSPMLAASGLRFSSTAQIDGTVSLGLCTCVFKVLFNILRPQGMCTSGTLNAQGC